MPFTLAHPAILLPFLKTKKHFLSATGLVVGSVVPDFDYLVKMSVKGQHSHSLTNLFLINLPVALVMAILFHKVIKNNLIGNLPAFFQSRFFALRQFDFIAYIKRYPFAFLAAAFFGAASHLLWDNFTHNGGFFVRYFSFYQSAIPYGGVKYPMFYALQQISTCVGLLSISLYILFMKPQPATVLTRPNLLYWAMVLLISTVFAFFRFALDRASLTIENLALTSITAICCSFLVVGRMRFSRATN